MILFGGSLNIACLCFKSLYSQQDLPLQVIPEIIQVEGDSNLTKAMSGTKDSQKLSEDKSVNLHSFIDLKA